MKRYAVSSFIPDPAARYWCFHWPESGLAVREEVVRGVPEPDRFRVEALPCQQPEHLVWGDDERWVVLEIDDRDFVEEEGQVQFTQGEVIFNGSPRNACKFLSERGLPVPCLPQEVKSGGDWDRVSTGGGGISIVGTHSRAESGERGITIGGLYSHVESGKWGLAYSHGGMAMAGRYGWAVSLGGEAVAADDAVAAAWNGDATAGDFGIAITSTELHTSRAGDRGLAVAAFGWSGGGTAIAGKHGMALAQAAWASTVQADEGGILTMFWEDGDRWRLAVAYVGENGIEPNVPYTLAEDGSFIPAKKE